MLFTRIPQQYAPLGGELRYAVSQETAGNIDIRIVDAAAGSAAGIGAAVSPGGADRAGTRGPVGDGSALLGAKRFAPSSALPSPTGPRVPALSAPPGETAAPIPAADPAAASTMRMSMFPAVS